MSTPFRADLDDGEGIVIERRPAEEDEMFEK